MDFSMLGGEASCRVEADGLYWHILAECHAPDKIAPRLFCDGHDLGRFWREGERWVLETRPSRRSLPITADTVFSLTRQTLTPYDPAQPLPDMAHFLHLRPVWQNGTLYLSGPSA